MAKNWYSGVSGQVKKCSDKGEEAYEMTYRMQAIAVW